MAQKIEEEIKKLEKAKAMRLTTLRIKQEGLDERLEELSKPSTGDRRRKRLESDVKERKTYIKTYQQSMEAIDTAIKTQKMLLQNLAIEKPKIAPKPSRRKEFEPEPLRQETITSKGGEINLKEEIGVTLSIPRNSTTKEEQVNFVTGFRGTCEMPEGVGSASPAYLIKTTNEVEFRENIDMTLQHTSNLQTVDDCEEMMFLKASTTSEDSDSILSFEIIDSADVKFIPGERHGSIKQRNFFSWFRIGRNESGNKKEKYYSARLYKAVTGIKVTAIFCMCLDHPTYIKRCDKVIPLEYPTRAKEKTCYNNVIVISDKIGLIMGESNTWKLFTDRSKISILEVERPECKNIKFSDLTDYPPRIVIDLTPTEQASDPAELNVMGLKDDCCFRIANDCFPKPPAEVSTQLLKDATEELKTKISEGLNFDSSVVTCARDIVSIVTEVEKLVHDQNSIYHLLKKIEEIREQIKNDVENSITKVTTISQQFKTLTSVMQRCSAGKPELWPGAVEVLVTNATNLLNAIAELLKATEIAAAAFTRSCSRGLVSSYKFSSNSPQQHISPRESHSSGHFTFPRSYSSSQAKRTVIELHHYGTLCQQLRPCAAKWKEIAQGLLFLPGEIDNIQANQMNHTNAPMSYMSAVLNEWMNRCPGDARGSTDVATLEELASAVSSAKYGRIAYTLNLN